MNIPFKEIIWQQFGAAIDDLENTMQACPEALWQAKLWHEPELERFFLPEFWYIIYHSLFWLDLYLTGSEEGFVPPEPFLLVEQHEEGPLPERPYTKAELQAYLELCRDRCRTTIESLTDEAAQQLCSFPWGEVNFAELLLYSMRHLAGHAAQLNLLLGQQMGSAPGWVTQADPKNP